MKMTPARQLFEIHRQSRHSGEALLVRATREDGRPKTRVRPGLDQCPVRPVDSPNYFTQSRQFPICNPGAGRRARKNLVTIAACYILTPHVHVNVDLDNSAGS